MSLLCHIQKELESFTLDVKIETDARRIGILGASGCGKSMTLRCIAGIEEPDGGEIVVDGRTLFNQEKKVCVIPQKRKVGYMFQRYALFPTMTVEENIEAVLHGSRREKKARAQELIERFALKGQEKKLPHKLSGGQQQRAALARIMAYEPDMILLDEPFSALDMFLKDKLQQELMEMLQEYQGTVILVSHSRDEIYRFSQELWIMDNGRMVSQGNTKEVFTSPGNRIAARLTGCKNLVSAERLDDHHLHIPQWGTTLELEQTISPEINCIGIRAHDFIPLWDSREKNSVAVAEGTMADLPFEGEYFLRSAADSQERICWYVQRDGMKEIEERGLPSRLQIPEDKLLLLRDNG